MIEGIEYVPNYMKFFSSFEEPVGVDPTHNEGFDLDDLLTEEEFNQAFKKEQTKVKPEAAKKNSTSFSDYYKEQQEKMKGARERSEARFAEMQKDFAEKMKATQERMRERAERIHKDQQERKDSHSYKEKFGFVGKLIIVLIIIKIGFMMFG